MSREPVKVIADILAYEMGLSSGQIMMAFENYEIPKTEGLFISISYVSSKTVGVSVYSIPVDTGMTEIQEASFDHLIQIDAMSFNDEARQRKDEIQMALNTNASQRFQGDNLMNISRHVSPFQDMSSLEETKMLRRFTTTVRVKALARKTKAADYYDTFLTPEVHTNA